jgi:hypothetical protein
MKKIFGIIASIVMLLVPTGLSQAEGLANNLYVESTRIDADGKGIVIFNAPLSTPASCGTGYPNMLAFNTNTVAGRAIYLLALNAQSTGKRIYAKGSGLCAVYNGGIEDWRWGQMIQ